MDSFEENVRELGEMMGQFKENYQKNIRDPQNISLESFKGLCHLQMHTTTFETEMDQMHKNIATTDGLISKWRTRLHITIIPEDPSLESIMNRFDSGTFYPGGDDGNYKSIGGGPGTGYNINVPWKQGNCGDADYLAVWDHVLIPVAKSYDPDIILISGGFDAALGDPLGGCRLTPYGYSLMTHKLMEFAGGKIVLALEGGYNLESLADSFASCVEALLADKLARSSSVLPPFESTWDVIQAVRQELRSFWPALNEDLPLPVLIKDDVLQSLEKLNVSSSDESSESGHEEFAEAGKITVNSTVLSVPFAETTESIIQPLTELKVDDDRHDNKGTPQSFLALNCDKGFPMTVVPSTSCYKDCNESALVSVLNDGNAFSWRELLRKTHIWYACYGSNMWKRRFLCYIKGGKVEGMSKDCSGSVDKTPPQDMQWKMVPHRLFFGRSYTQTWGSGGVSFLHPIHSGNSKAHVCLYKITLEQFNDLLLQENCMSFKTDYPLVDIASVDAIRNENRILNVIEGGWYGTVVYLGMEGGLPILSFTCSISDIEKFKHGQLVICPPSSKYVNVLLKGLVDGRGLSEGDAIAYIEEASKLSL